MTQIALPHIKRMSKVFKSKGGTVLEGMRLLFGDDSTSITNSIPNRSAADLVC